MHNQTTEASHDQRKKCSTGNSTCGGPAIGRTPVSDEDQCCTVSKRASNPAPMGRRLFLRRFIAHANCPDSLTLHFILPLLRRQGEPERRNSERLVSRVFGRRRGVKKISRDTVQQITPAPMREALVLQRNLGPAGINGPVQFFFAAAMLSATLRKNGLPTNTANVENHYARAVGSLKQKRQEPPGPALISRVGRT